MNRLGAMVMLLGFLVMGSSCAHKQPMLVDGGNVWWTPPGTVITRPDGTMLTVTNEPGMWARRDVWDWYRER